MDTMLNLGQQLLGLTQHTVNLWNSLPQDMVITSISGGFSRGLDKSMEDGPTNGYMQ